MATFLSARQATAPASHGTPQTGPPPTRAGRWLALRLIAAALLLAVTSCGDRQTVGSDGPFAVGWGELTLVDASRPTAANGAAPAKPERTLLTRVYYPARGAPGSGGVRDADALREAGPFPLVVFAHGFQAVAEVYQELLGAWAEAGYVVAAPNFPLSSARAEGGPVAADLPNQPGDVSFVIDRMLELDRTPSSPLEGMIDERRIAAAGHSLGGMTTLAVAFHTCCADARIRAAIPMSARAVPFPGGEYFTGIRIPMLAIHGDADETVPYQEGRQYFDAAQSPKVLVTILGGDHIVPFVAGRSRPETAPTRVASIAFLDLYLKGRPDALDRLLTVDALPLARVESRLR